MTVFTVYLDDKPQAEITYDYAENVGPVPVGQHLTDGDLLGLPEPILTVIDGLLNEEHSCGWPGCRRPVGYTLDEREDPYGREVPYEAWAPVAVVWDDAQRIVQSIEGYDIEPMVVLTLCEDHSPVDPYDAYDTAVGEAMAADAAAEEIL